MARARPGKFRGAIPKSPGAASKSMKIKDQGTVPLSQPKQQANGGPPQPGMGKGNSRGGGAALRGTKFEGVF